MEQDVTMYQGFADTYDRLMDEIPYDAWHAYILELLRENQIEDGIVVDLACGTGAMTSRLAADGYDVIGIDLSAEMLEAARDKCPDSVLLLQQDMCELDLYGTARAFVCVCDGMNYLTELEMLRQTFEKVFLFLDQDGVFLFDMKTAYFYEHCLGDQTISDNREDVWLIWEIAYDIETGLNEYLLTIFAMVDEERQLFERTEEYHVQRAYPLQDIMELLQQCGFQADVYEACTKEAPSAETERVYFVAHKRPA